MSSAHISRRESLVLPSRRKHGLFAVLFLASFAALIAMLVLINGRADDSKSAGIIPIITATPSALTPELTDSSLTSPDLLADEVPDGVNPTVEIAAKLDALGNPVGATPPTEAPTPKTIKIDGVSLGPTSLPVAPLPGLVQRGTFGPVPAKTANGGTALNRYNRPFTAPSGKRPVSLIIGGLGINRQLTQQAIDLLPADVTLSFASHSSGLQDWINAARADGHEVLIEIPMESAEFDASEPGADRALRLNISAQDNRRNLDWALSRAQGYWGVTNYNGDAFLRRADVVAPILDRLSNTGLALVTDGSFETPSLSALSQSVGLPLKTGYGLIDPDPSPQLIQVRLSELSNAALATQHPVGIGFAYPATLSAAADWIETLDAKDLVLAPASASVE